METTRQKITKPDGYNLTIETGKDNYGEHESVSGYVNTPYGYVNAFCMYWYDSEGKPRQCGHLYYTYQGYEYIHRFEKYYSRRYLVTLANRFAKQITQQNEKKI